MRKCNLKTINNVRAEIAKRLSVKKGSPATDAEVNQILEGLMESGKLRMETPSEALGDAFNNFLNDEIFTGSGGGGILRQLLEDEGIISDRIKTLKQQLSDIVEKDGYYQSQVEEAENLTDQLQDLKNQHEWIQEALNDPEKAKALNDDQKKILDKEFMPKYQQLQQIMGIKIPQHVKKLLADKKGRSIARKNREEWRRIQTALDGIEAQLRAKKTQIENESRNLEQLSTPELWHLATPDFLIESRILNIRKTRVRHEFTNIRNQVKEMFTDDKSFVSVAELVASLPYFTEAQVLALLKENGIVDAKLIERSKNETPLSRKEALKLLKELEKQAIQKSQRIDQEAEDMKLLVNLLGSFEEAEAQLKEKESREILADLRATVDGGKLDTPAVEFSPKFVRTDETRASSTLPDSITKTKNVLTALGLTDVDTLEEFNNYAEWIADTSKVVSFDVEWDPETEQIVSFQIATLDPDNVDNSEVSIVYSSKGKGEFLTTEDVEGQLQLLEDLQNEGYKVVSYNGNRADFKVLSNASNNKNLVARVALRAIDLQNQAEEVATAVYPSLNNTAKALGVKGKREAQEGEPAIGGANAADMLRGTAVDPATNETVDITESQRLFEEYGTEDVRANLRVFLAFQKKTGQQITIDLNTSGPATGTVRSVKPTWFQGSVSDQITLTGVGGVLQNLAEADPSRDLEATLMDIESSSIPLASEQTLTLEAQEAMLTDLLNGLVTYEESGRHRIKESELVSILKKNNPKLAELGKDVVADFVERLNFVTTFGESVDKTTLGTGDPFFDLRSLRDFVYHRRAWILTKMGETQGVTLAVEELKKRRDPNNPNSEHSALLHLERVQQDKNALRAYGQMIFNSEDHPLAGKYILGVDSEGNYITTESAQEYIDAFNQELIAYITSTDNMNSYERARLIENLTKIVDESGRPILEYTDESVGPSAMNVEIAKALAKLMELSFASDNTIANFGNGKTGYTNADLLARGLVDMVIGKREGIRRHLYSEQEMAADGSIVNPDTVANPFASKYIGGVADVNHSAPANQVTVEKVKADIQTRARVESALAIRMTPARREAIKEWLSSQKEIAQRLTRDHPMPIGLVPITPEGDPTKAPRTLDDIMEEFHTALFNNDIVYFHFEHDSETMPTDVRAIGRDGNFGEDFTGALDPELGKKIGFEGQYLAPLQMSDGTVFLASPFSRLGAKALAWERTYGFEALADLQLGAFLNYIDTMDNPTVDQMFISGNFNNYYDGTFNGLHHLAAMLVEVNQEQPYSVGMVEGIDGGTVTLQDIQNVKLREGNELGDFLMKSKLLLQKILKEKHNVDFHLKLASRALGDLVSTALDESLDGDLRNQAIKTIEFLKRHNVLTPDVTLDRLQQITQDDTTGENLRLLLEEQSGLRSFFKPATMDRVYSAGTNTIINDLRARDNFPTEQDGKNAELDDDYAESFDFLARILKGTAQKDQAALLQFGLNGIQSNTTVDLTTTDATGKETTVPVAIDEVLGITNKQKEAIINGLRESAKKGQRRLTRTEGATEGTLQEVSIVDDSVRDRGIIRLSDAQSFNSTGVQAQILRVKAIQAAAGLYDPNKQPEKFNAYVKKLLTKVAEANSIMTKPLLESVRDQLEADAYLKGNNKVEAMLKLAGLIMKNDPALQVNSQNAINTIAKEYGVKITDGDIKRLGHILKNVNDNKDELVTEEVKAEVRKVSTGFDENQVALVKALGALSATGRAINMEAFNEFSDSVGQFVTEDDLLGLENFVVYHMFGIDSASHRFYPTHHKLSMLSSELAKQRGIEDGSQIRGIWDFAIDTVFSDDNLLDAFQNGDPAATQMIRDRIEELMLRTVLLETAHLNLIDSETGESADILSELALADAPDNARLESLIPLMDPTHPDHDVAVLNAWHDRSQEANRADVAIQRDVAITDAGMLGSELEQTDTRDADSTSKVFKPMTTGRFQSRVPRASTQQEQSEQKTKLTHNMGPGAFLPMAAETPFEYLGNPVFREWSLRQNLERAAPVAKRVDDLFNTDSMTEEEISLVDESSFTARREYSTDSADLRGLLVSSGREDAAYVGGFTTDVDHEATVLEGKLRTFAKEWAIEDMVEDGLWEDVLYLYRLKPKLVALDRQLNRQLLRDLETKSPEDQARIIDELKFKRKRIIAEANKWAKEANGKKSSFYEAAPEGNLPALTADVLFQEDGTPRSFVDIFARLGNKFNNLYSFKMSLSFAPGEYMLLNPEDSHSSSAGIIVEGGAPLPKYIHGADATMVMESVLSNLSRRGALKKHIDKIHAHYESKYGKTPRSVVMRQLDNNFHKMILENFDPALIKEIFEDIRNDPEYKDLVETPMFVVESLEGFDEILVDGKITPVRQSGTNTPAHEVGLSKGQGARGTRVESSMRGTTARVGITLDGAIKMLNQISNGKLMQDIRSQTRANIVETEGQRAVAVADQLDRQDPMTGLSLEQSQIKAQLDHDMIKIIKQRNSQNPDSVTVPSADHGFRRSWKDRSKFATALDFGKAENRKGVNASVEERTERGHILFTRRFESSSQLAQNSNLIPAETIAGTDSSLFRSDLGSEIILMPEMVKTLANMNKLTKAQKLIVGYMLASDTDNPVAGMLLDVDKAPAVDVQEFLATHNKDNILTKTFTALKTVENLTRGSTDYSNKYYFEARAFVLGALTTGAEAHNDNLSMYERFVTHLRDTGAMLDFDAMTPAQKKEHGILMHKALYQAAQELDSVADTHVPSVDPITGDHSAIVPGGVITPKEARTGLSRFDKNYHVIESLDMLVEKDIISSSAADKLAVILHNLSEHNPELLSSFQIEVRTKDSTRAGTHVVSGGIARPHIIVIDPVNFDGSDLTAIDILLEEVVHIAQLQTMNMEENSSDYQELVSLMRNKHNRAFVTKLIKHMYNGLPSNEVNEKVNYYLSNPHEFIGRATVFFIKNDNAEVLTELVNQEQQDRLRAADSSGSDLNPVTLTGKLKQHIRRVMNFAKAYIFNIRSTFNSYRDQSPEEFAKLQSVVSRIIGSNTSKVNNREGIILGYFAGSEVADAGEMRVVKPKNDAELDYLNEEVTRLKREERKLRQLRQAAVKGERRPSTHEINSLKEEIQLKEKVLLEAAAESKDRRGVDGIERQDFRRNVLSKYPANVVKGSNLTNATYDASTMLRHGIIGNSTPAARRNTDIFISIIMQDLSDQAGDIQTKNRNNVVGRNFASGDFFGVGVATEAEHTKYSNDHELFVLSTFLDHDAMLTIDSFDTERKTDIATESRMLKIQLRQQIYAKYQGLRSDLKPLVLAEITKQMNGDLSTKEDGTKKDLFNYARDYIRFVTRLQNKAQNNGVGLTRRGEHHVLPLKKSRRAFAAGFKKDQRMAIGETLETHIAENIQKSSGAVDADGIVTDDGQLDIFTLISAGILPPVIFGPQQQIDEATATRTFSDPDFLAWVEDHPEIISFIEREYNSNKKINEAIGGDIEAGKPLLKKSLRAKTIFLAAATQIAMSTAFANGVKLSALNLNPDQFKRYQEGITKSFSTTQHRYAQMISRAANPAAKQNISIISQTYDDRVPSNPARLRRKIHDAELGARAKFFQRGRMFDIDTDWALAESRNPDSSLFGYFETDMANMADDMHKGLFMDVLDSEVVSRKTGMQGLRLDQLLELYEQTDIIQADNENIDIAKMQNQKTEALKVLRAKHQYATGRRAYVDVSSPSAKGFANLTRDLTLIGYGANLAPATAIMEGTLSGLRAANLDLRNLSAPITMLLDVIAGVAGSIGKEVSGLGGSRLASVAETRLSEDSAQLSMYGLRHSTLRSLEENSNESLVNENLLVRSLGYLGGGLNNTAKFFAGLSTAPAAGVLTGLKNSIDGISIATILRMRRRGVLRKAAEVLSKPEMRERLENAQTNPELMKVVDDILKQCEYDGRMRIPHKVLGQGHVRKQFIHMARAGLLNTKFLDNFSKLISAAHDGVTLTGDENNIDKNMVNMGKLFEVAMNSDDIEFRENSLEVLQSLSDFINYEIESSITVNNTLDTDTRNHPLAVAAKLYRQYPSTFFSQRVLNDMQFMTKRDMVFNLLTYISLDLSYMVFLDFMRAGGFAMREEHRRQYLEEILSNRAEYFTEKIARSPVFAGSQNHYVSAAVAGLFDTIHGKNGAQAFGQAFMGNIGMQRTGKSFAGATSIIASLGGANYDVENPETSYYENLQRIGVLQDSNFIKPVIDEIFAFFAPEAYDEVIRRRHERMLRQLQKMGPRKGPSNIDVTGYNVDSRENTSIFNLREGIGPEGIYDPADAWLIQSGGDSNTNEGMLRMLYGPRSLEEVYRQKPQGQPRSVQGADPQFGGPTPQRPIETYRKGPQGFQPPAEQPPTDNKIDPSEDPISRLPNTTSPVEMPDQLT